MQTALRSGAFSSLQHACALSCLLRASSILLDKSNSSIQTAPCSGRSSWAHSSQSAPQHAPDPFGDPPALPQRRVVVTGIGMVTPLGVGVADSWQSLLAGRTGVRRLQAEDLPEVWLTVGSDSSCRGPAQHLCLQQTALAQKAVSLLGAYVSCCCHCCSRRTVHTCRSCPVRWWQQCQGSRQMRQQQQLGWTLDDTHPSSHTP